MLFLFRIHSPATKQRAVYKTIFFVSLVFLTQQNTTKPVMSYLYAPGNQFISGTHVPQLNLDAAPGNSALYVALKSSDSTGDTFSFTFPSSMGTTGYLLSTDGNSATNWVSVVGSTGATGVTGPTGSTGPTGPTGATGATGFFNILRNFSTGTQTINTTSYVNINGLTFSIGAAESAAFHFHIVFRSAATGTGFGFSINGPAGTFSQ